MCVSTVKCFLQLANLYTNSFVVIWIVISTYCAWTLI